MAGKGAVLAIRIVSDASKAKQGFAEAQTSAERFTSGLSRATPVALGVAGGIAVLGKSAVDAASQLQQATGAVEAVFGSMAAQVKKQAAAAADDYGLSAADFSNSAALIGSQLKNMGFSAGAAWDQTKDLIGLGSDLAAQYGGTAAEAVAALSSALKGERDPIERYAVTLTQASIDAKVAAMGLDTSTEAAKRNAAAQATLALVTEQTTSAHGAHARELDTAAGAAQTATAKWENAKAALGDVLLPVVAAAANKMAEWSGVLVRNKDVILPLLGVLGTLAGGILGINGALKVYSATQTAVDAVLNASPLMRLVMIITLIVSAVIYMYQKFEWFRDLVSTIGDAIKWAFDKAAAIINWVIDKLSFLGDAASWVGDLFSAGVTVPVTAVASGGVSGLSGVYGAAGPAGAMLYGAAAGSSGTAGAGGRSPAGPGSTYVTNVTVQGAVDPDGTARTIEDLLDRRDKQLGRRAPLSFGRSS